MTTSTLTGAGEIRAKGGSATWKGGGGAGGRIAVYPSSDFSGFQGSIRCDGGAGRCEGSGCAAADGGIGDVYFNQASGVNAAPTTDLVVRGHWVGLFPPERGYKTVTVSASANLTWAPHISLAADSVEVQGALHGHRATFDFANSFTVGASGSVVAPHLSLSSSSGNFALNGALTSSRCAVH